MKKQYIQPTLSEYRIETISVIAGSITGTSGADGLDLGGGTSEGGIISGNSRGSSFWDDDEE